MTRPGRAGLLLVLGVVAVRLLWTGGYGWFVQQRMFIPLVLAALVLLALGGREAYVGMREERRDPDLGRRSVAPAVGWLLALPLVVLVAVAPTGLGAAAANRVEAFTPTDQATSYSPLDASGGPVEMRVFSTPATPA